MLFLSTRKLADSLRVSPSEPIAPTRRLLSINKDSDSIQNTAKRLSTIIIGNLYDFDESLKDPTYSDYPKRIDFVVSELYLKERRTEEASRTLAHISSEVVRQLRKHGEDKNDTGIIHPCDEVFKMAVTDIATRILAREWNSYSDAVIPPFSLDSLRSASTIYADLVAVGLIEMNSVVPTLKHLQASTLRARGLQGALLFTIDVMSRACTVPAGTPTLPREAWTSLLKSLEVLQGASDSKDFEVLKDFATAFERTDMNTGVLDWTLDAPSDRVLLARLHAMCEGLWKLRWTG